MSEHTPGPWHWEPGHEINWGPAIYAGDATPADDIEDSERYVAEVIGGGPQAVANARLIAAAPALLEALENLRDHHIDHRNSRGGEWDDHCVREASGAIAQARSES